MLISVMPPAAMAQAPAGMDLSIAAAVTGSGRGVHGDQLLILLVVHDGGPADATGVALKQPPALLIRTNEPLKLTCRRPRHPLVG